MIPILRHPALVLAILGAASGALGTYLPGPSAGEPPLAVYGVLVGVWFGLVVAFGAWSWGSRSWLAAPVALLATWIGWQAAVNLTLMIGQDWLSKVAMPDLLRTCISGLAGGAVGA